MLNIQLYHWTLTVYTLRSSQAKSYMHFTWWSSSVCALPHVYLVLSTFEIHNWGKWERKKNPTEPSVVIYSKRRELSKPERQRLSQRKSLVRTGKLSSRWGRRATRSRNETFLQSYLQPYALARLHLKDDTLHLGTEDCFISGEENTEVFHLGLEDLGPSANFMIRLWCADCCGDGKQSRVEWLLSTRV